MKLVIGAAGLLQNEQNQILITERPEGKFMAGYWEFPGGKIEENETPEEALQRELYEEIGIEVDLKDLDPFYFISSPYPEYHALLPIFHIIRWKGTPEGKEGQRLAWVSIEEMDTIHFLPANKPIIEHLKNRQLLTRDKKCIDL